jgi:hypothetical protein
MEKLKEITITSLDIDSSLDRLSDSRSFMAKGVVFDKYEVTTENGRIILSIVKLSEYCYSILSYIMTGRSDLVEHLDKNYRSYYKIFREMLLMVDSSLSLEKNLQTDLSFVEGLLNLLRTFKISKIS